MEALLLLYEDKRGIRQHEKNFLVTMKVEGKVTGGGMVLESMMRPPPVSNGAATLTAQNPGDGAVGAQSPSRRAGTPSGGTPGTPGPDGNESLDADRDNLGDPSEFTLADSFVLNVLRGFRLLQSAGLSAEEKRDILSATKGDLDFSVVVAAIQTLWDEQFLGRRQQQPRNHGNSFMDTCTVDEYNGNQDWGHHDGYDHYGTDGWNDSTWDDWGWYDADWMDTQDLQPERAREDPPPDQDLQESMQAEKEAENLALQANRTWAEAHSATQALRRDRGFGQTPKANVHLQWQPLCQTSVKGEGKGGKNHYVTEWDDGASLRSTVARRANPRRACPCIGWTPTRFGRAMASLSPLPVELLSMPMLQSCCTAWR